jgi:hypothetical protein
MNIDELVVELSLDPTKFTEGQREALDSFRKTNEEMEKQLKNLEARTNNASLSFHDMTSAAHGLFKVLIGAEVLDFTKHVIDAGAATGRLATVTGIAGPEMSAFGKMIQNNGGNAEAATESLHGLARAMQELKWGNVSEDFLIGFGQLQDVVPSLNKDSKPTDIAFALAKFADTHTAQEVEQVANRIGLSMDIVYQALRGSAKSADDFGEAMKIALSSEQIKKMEDAQRAINDMDQSLKALATTAVSTAAPDLKKFADRLKPYAQDPMAQIRADAKKDLEEAAKEGRVDPVAKAILWAVGDKDKSIPAGGHGAFYSNADKEEFIRSSARKADIDPDVAMAVAYSEGFHNFKSTIPGEKSYGAFQLHVTPGGGGNAVGDQFQKLTGLDPSDPANEKETIMFAMEWAKRHGWHDFHGAKKTNIGDHQGINIGTVNLPNVKNGRDFVKEIRQIANNSNSPGPGQ